jgi:hypothetical protein
MMTSGRRKLDESRGAAARQVLKKDVKHKSSRWLGPLLVVAFAAVATPLSSQTPDWGKWTEHTIPIAYPGEKTCTVDTTNGKKQPEAYHTHWVCKPGCGDNTNDYCWTAMSDAIYTCTDGKGFRRLAASKSTHFRCGKKDWQMTQYYAGLYGETWATAAGPPTEPATAVVPPTDDGQLPPPTSGQQPQFGSGFTPELEKVAKDDPKNPANAEKIKSDTAKTSTPSVDDGQAKKRPRKEVKKTTKHRRARIERGQSSSTGGVSPETANAIGNAIGIGIGIGVGSGRRMEGDSHGGMMRRDAQ